MKNYIQIGSLLTFIASAPVRGGAPFVVGELAGVATSDADKGQKVVVAFEGVYALSKVVGTGSAVAIGQALYATADGLVTTVADKNIRIGHAIESASDSDASLKVVLLK